MESTVANERNLQQDQKNYGVKNERIVIWCGSAPNQRALANKIAARYNLAGIVIDRHRAVGPQKPRNKILPAIWDRIRFKKIYDAWSGLMNYYTRQFPKWPAGVPVIEVDSINDSATKEFTGEANPGLIVVSGTALIKEDLISAFSGKGIINLHTGLSPYVKGGPNCTNWCIANNSFHLTGNTIMWLNAGIDSGNIITTETVNILKARSLTEAQRIVMEHAHDLYLRAIGYLMTAEPPYTSVVQNSIAPGNLFFTKMWTKEKKKLLLRNWKQRRRFSSLDNPVTIPLPGAGNNAT